MKKYKFALWVSLLLNAILIFTFLYLVLISNQSDSIPVNPVLSKNPVEDSFDFKNYLTPADSDNVANKFPFNDYLKTERYKDPGALKNDLEALDILYPMNRESGSNLSTLFNTVTDTLFISKKQKFIEYNPDEFITTLQWAESLKFGSVYDLKNALFYSAVSDYWLNLLAQKLNELSKNNPSIKYSYKFKYLQSRLAEGSYIISPAITPIEKVALNINQNKWSHLIQATWNQTSFFQKIVFVLIMLLTSFCYIYTLFLLLKKWKRSKIIS